MGDFKVGVVGAGTIGVGVAQDLAQNGLPVVLVDQADEFLDRARSKLTHSLRFASLFDVNAANQDLEQVLSRIEFTIDYKRLAGVSLVVENATESWATKEIVYKQMEEICPPESIFAVNTSAISITKVAALTRRPDRVIGIHFMNPVPQKPVVEVIRGWHTSDETLLKAKTFLSVINKRAVVVNDMPGFVSNRVLMLTINEAVFVVQDNVASPRDVDEIFVQCFSHKMGPLATADLIGLDTVLRTLDVLHESYKDDKYRACPLLRKMVDAGVYGRKSERGFFEYNRGRM